MKLPRAIKNQIEALNKAGKTSEAQTLLGSFIKASQMTEDDMKEVQF